MSTEMEAKARKPRSGLLTAGVLQHQSNKTLAESSLGRTSLDSTHLTNLAEIAKNGIQSSGQPLDKSTREFMEPRFGRDFSKVRVHTDSKAAASAMAVNSVAYTVGNDIAFDFGQFTSTNNRGRKLLAHELAHVVQQSPNSDLASSPPSKLELEAEQAADAINSDASGINIRGHGAIDLSRQEAAKRRGFGELIIAGAENPMVWAESNQNLEDLNDEEIDRRLLKIREWLSQHSMVESDYGIMQNYSSSLMNIKRRRLAEMLNPVQRTSSPAQQDYQIMDAQGRVMMASEAARVHAAEGLQTLTSSPLAGLSYGVASGFTDDPEKRMMAANVAAGVENIAGAVASVRAGRSYYKGVSSSPPIRDDVSLIEWRRAPAEAQQRRSEPLPYATNLPDSPMYRPPPNRLIRGLTGGSAKPGGTVSKVSPGRQSGPSEKVQPTVQAPSKIPPKRTPPEAPSEKAPTGTAKQGITYSPGESLPDNEIILIGSNKEPGNFILREQDFKPIGPVNSPGKSASIASDLTSNEIAKMFSRPPVRGDILCGAFAKDIRAAGFDVKYAPTSTNPYHVRIIAKTNSFNGEGRTWLSMAFDKLLKVKK